MSNAALDPRQRRREEKTRVFLEHAAALVLENGLDGLTMPGLARRAGVAVGGLYRYFENKQHLMAALQIEALREMHAWMRAHCGGNGLSGLRSMVTCVSAFSQAHPTSFTLLDIAVSDPRQILDDDLAEAVGEAVEPILQGVDRCLESAVRNGELTAGETRQRTLILWSLVFGCLHHRKTDRRKRDPNLHAEAVLNAGLDALLRGWGATA